MADILFFASSHKIGLTGQLTEQAIVFERMYPGHFLFVSGEKEQFPGLADKLQCNHVLHRKIIGLDEHANFFKLLRDFVHIIDQYEIQHVMAHTNWQFAISLFAKFIIKRNMLISYTIHGYRHNSPIRSLFARIMIGMSLLLFASKVVTPSTFLKNKFRLLGKKNEVIFLGEDNAFFDENHSHDFSGDINMVFPGEFRSGKRQDMLIRVLRYFINRSGNKNIFLHLPGKGDKLPEYKKLVLEYGLENNVFFPGFINRSEMFELYKKCHFAIVPSNIETFGHCIVEPLLLGAIVITRHVGVADDIIKHGENGFFFDSEKDLLELLLKIVPDHKLCERVSRNTLANREVFKWESVCHQHALRIYKHLLIETMPTK